MEVMKETSRQYESFTDDELVLAVELMVSPQDLKIRDVAASLLASLDFTEDEVREHIQSGIYLNSGPSLDLLETEKLFV